MLKFHTLKPLFILVVITSIEVSANDNKIDVGFSKFNNTWNFIGNAYYKLNTNYGDWLISNDYQGTAIDNIANSFRDNEQFFSSYNYPLIRNNSIFKNLSLSTEVKYNLISDKNVGTKNKLMRMSGVAGITGNVSNYLNYKLLYGAENNYQSGIQSAGQLFNGNVALDNIDIDGYQIKSQINSELLYLNDNRSSKDIDATLGLARVFSKNEQLQIGVHYKMQDRDFLQSSTISSVAENFLIVESNLDNHISATMNGSLEIAENYLLNFDGNFENINVRRDYKENYENITNSKVFRYFNEQNINIKIDIDVDLRNYFHKIGVLFTNRVEQNNIEKHFDIDNATFINMQMFESQKDNNSSTTNLFYNNKLKLSKYDTIKANLSIIKIEYNTPSTANNDDRDEVNDAISLEYDRKCSDILTFVTKLNYHQNHIVFIKKERSSQNNINRIITLNTGVFIRSEMLIYHPQFEILANYTVYDFETVDNKSRSYSFRQIAYKDSLLINFNKKYFLTNKISFRTYEQGKLYWSSFSELPQQRNIEFSAYPMFNCKINDKMKVGIGGRLFYLIYGQIDKSNSIYNPNKIFTFAPETSFSLRLNKITLNFYGWLEHKSQQNKFIEIKPNIFLQTSYNL